MEQERITPIDSWATRDVQRGNRDGGGPPAGGSVTYNASTTYTMYKGTYPGGSITPAPIVVDGTSNADDARAAAQPYWNVDNQRINNANAQRAALVYDPIDKFLASIASLKSKYVTTALRNSEALRRERSLSILAERIKLG